MLKLTASYSKKVPAETEYSSQSFHCCVEIEIAEGLNKEQLDTKIHDTFAIVKNSVEAELHGKTQQQQASYQTQEQSQNGSQGYPSPPQNNREVPASPKQIKYLLDLARNVGMTPAQIAAKFNVPSVQDLTKSQCSGFINSWKAA